MSEARNVYPRLCWGCLGVIEDYEHDHALLNYGGFCTDCHKRQPGEMPGLREALRGYTERMNDVSERDELLRELSMSEHDESSVQYGTVRDESTDEPVRMGWLEAALLDTEQGAAEPPNELATGGVIENGGLAYNGPDSPEGVFTSPDGIKVNFTVNGWPANPTLLNPGGVPYAWNNNAAAGTWINPAYSQPVTYHIPPPPAITEERIRQIVSETMHKVLYPESDGIVSAHEHRRIRQWDESGTEWRGVLYKVAPEDEPILRSKPKGPSGICWVCGKPGEDMATFVRGPGLPTVHMHSTNECIAGAHRKDKEESDLDG